MSCGCACAICLPPGSPVPDGWLPTPKRIASHRRVVRMRKAVLLLCHKIAAIEALRQNRGAAEFREAREALGCTS